MNSSSNLSGSKFYKINVSSRIHLYRQRETGYENKETIIKAFTVLIVLHCISTERVIV